MKEGPSFQEDTECVTRLKDKIENFKSYVRQLMGDPYDILDALRPAQNVATEVDNRREIPAPQGSKRSFILTNKQCPIGQRREEDERPPYEAIHEVIAEDESDPRKGVVITHCFRSKFPESEIAPEGIDRLTVKQKDVIGGFEFDSSNPEQLADEELVNAVSRLISQILGDMDAASYATTHEGAGKKKRDKFLAFLKSNIRK